MELKKLKVADCFPSKTNPRNGAKAAEIAAKDLMASIKAQGILQPVLARKVGKKYEIIAGSRRLRAAQELGLLEIPAQVVTMNDSEVIEAQIVENLQRADVHPLDEGEAYRHLIETLNHDIEGVALRVGKSITYVRDRLVLTDLIKKVKEAFRAEKISAGHAALIARLDEKMQTSIFKWLLEQSDYNSEVITATTKELRDEIQERVYLESTKTPPWSGDDGAKIVFEGCKECKGKGGDLFGKNATDECGNPKCHAERMAAWIAMQLAENPKLVKISGDYSSTPEMAGSGSYKEITGGKGKCGNEAEAIIVVGRGIGHKKTICVTASCEKHWPTSKPGGGYKQTKKERETRKAQLKAQRTKKENSDKAIAKAIQKVKMPLSEKHLDILFDVVFRRFGYSYLQPIASRYGIKADKKKTSWGSTRDLDTPLKKFFSDKGKNGKLQFIFEVGIEAVGGSGDKAFIGKL